MESSAVSPSPFSPTFQTQNQDLDELFSRDKWFSKSSITVATASVRSIDNDSARNLKPRLQGRRSLLQRFGPCAGVLLLTIFLLIALPVVAISLLWLRQDLAVSETVLRAGWSPQLITIATGVLRLGILLLSGICTAHMASLILQGRHSEGVPLVSVAGFSLLRFARSDPIFLMSELASALQYTNRSTSRGRLVRYTILASLLAGTTIFFQFSATVLFNDVRDTYIPDTPYIDSIPSWSQYLNDHPSESDVANVWSTGLQEITRFAHYQPFAATQGQRITQDGWDTGESLRGFLPFSSSHEREAVSQVHGSLPVLDARYACFRPTEFSASLLRQTFSNSNQSSFTITGVSVADATRGSSVPQYWGSRIETTFNCTFPTRASGKDVDPSETHSDTPIVLCSANLKTPNDHSKAYLLLTIDGTQAEWSTYYQSMLRSPNAKATTNLTFLPKDGWLQLSSSAGTNIRLSATICYTRHSLQLYPSSTITRDTFQTPPQYPPLKILWDQTLHRFYSTGILTTLSTPSYILTLDPYTPPTTNQFSFLTQSFSLPPTTPAIFCLTCALQPTQGAIIVGKLSTTIAQDILANTDNPAQMLQTLFTLLFQQAYYANRPMFERSSTTKISLFVRRQAPVYVEGYSVVLGILGLYLLLAGGVVVVFISRAKKGDMLVGNAWSAVGQVAKLQETREFVGVVAGMTDGEVGEYLDVRGRRYEVVKVD